MYVFVGVAFGTAVALTSAARGTQPWLIWAALAISLTAASGAVFGYGLARWPEIVASFRPSRRRLAAYVARGYSAPLGMLTVAVVLSIATEQDASLVTGGSIRGLLLVAFAGFATLPVVAGLGAIYERARMLDASPWGNARRPYSHFAGSSPAFLAPSGVKLHLRHSRWAQHPGSAPTSRAQT